MKKENEEKRLQKPRPKLPEVKKFVDQDTGEVVQLGRYRSQADAYLYDPIVEKNMLPGMTVPGQSMTVQEMVRRHKAGLPIDQKKGVLFSGEELIPDLNDMDLVDRAAYMDAVADQLIEVRARIAEATKSKEQKEFLEAVDKKFKEELAKHYPDGKKPIDKNDSTIPSGSF